MLVKTPEFNKRFIGDLSEIIIGSKMYKEILSKEASVGMDYNYFLEKKGLFKNVSFVGSYPGKQYNEIISDIDVVQTVVINNNFTLRLQQIIAQLRNPASSFKFIRFYCGLKRK